MAIPVVTMTSMLTITSTIAGKNMTRMARIPFLFCKAAVNLRSPNLLKLSDFERTD
jgi:hypothetical protein